MYILSGVMSNRNMMLLPTVLYYLTKFPVPGMANSTQVFSQGSSRDAQSNTDCYHCPLLHFKLDYLTEDKHTHSHTYMYIHEFV